MKRRDFLTGTTLAGLGMAASPRLARAQVVRPDLPVGRARNIIFCVYDGFSWEDFSVARYYARRHRGRTLALERLFSLGKTGSMSTHSLTSIVTDSAAASTAWGTGRLTANANIGMFPDGRSLTTILELAKGQGLSTGLITSARVTHATPAGFASHVIDRNLEDDIATQYLELKPDVILGGGARHFGSDTREDGRELYAEFKAAGYALARTADELCSVTGSRMLGTFSSSHLPYEIDRLNQDAGGPSLAEITRKGLSILSEGSRGFVAQVEAGRIDHANHNNDPASMLWEVLAADEALEVVLDFVDRNPGTLMILASDHGTGGGALYGVGTDYQLAGRALDRIASRRASYDFILERLGKTPQVPEVTEAAAEYLGVRLSPERAAAIVDAIEGHPPLRNLAAYHEQPANSIAEIVASGRDFDDPENLNIQYSAGQHTAGPVPIAVYGTGTSEAQLGLVDNAEIFTWMTSALGIEYENPIMSEAEALAILEGRAGATGTEG